MKKYITAILIFIAFAAQAQSIKQLKQDMYGIASDVTEGRFTGSPGYLKAAHYVSTQLKASGLKVSFQAVPFVWDNYDGSTIKINGVSYGHKGGNFIVLQHAQLSSAWVILKEMPDSIRTAELAKNNTGVILLPNEQQGSDWETTVIRQYRFGYMCYAADYISSNAQLNVMMISPVLAAKLNGPDVSATIACKHDGLNGYNLIASKPGRGKTIVVGAHLDHIGRLGDHIYDGANDDGSGCVALMAAARSLAKRPVKRPLLFVFYCGEELNLVGSRYFMDHPPVAVKDILMNINLEQVGSKHRSFRGIWGLGDPRFQNDLMASGDGLELKYSVTDSVRDVLSNTDSYSFMKKGVPSLLLGSGGFDEHHTPQDKIDLIDFPHLQRVSLLLSTLIKKLAN